MSCAYGCMKWILFLFNMIWVILGIAILAIGVWAHLEAGHYEKIADTTRSAPIIFIIIGVIVFVIAFFGCCGAIRESHCMVVTYAVFLLTLLIIQIAIGIWVFVESNNMEGISANEFIEGYRTNIFNNYWKDENDREIVDVAQRALQCCGVTSPSDFNGLGGPGNNTIPWSCCGNNEDVVCTSNIYQEGCGTKAVDAITKSLKIIGGVLIGVAATELVGIIFALCLANSIRNDDRRGYRV